MLYGIIFFISDLNLLFAYRYYFFYLCSKCINIVYIIKQTYTETSNYIYLIYIRNIQ